jgi:PHP family Zn ribbon phosphoesterase
VHLIPLQEIIAAALNRGINTKTVQAEYHRLISHGGSEFRILLDLDKETLAGFVPEKVLRGIMNVRENRLHITPGYDGVFGKIDIFSGD